MARGRLEARREEAGMVTEMAARGVVARARELVADRGGQGTTEYAILVGVLVVIAIAAILLFRDKVSELWNAIASGINSL